MIKIDVQNLQAIADAHIEIPENGLVEFTGNNSNGKSVISKVIEAMTSGDIRNKDIRRTLIRDHCEQGVIVFTHNHEQLGLLLVEELAQSMIMYKPDRINKPDEVVIRSLNDIEGCEFLITQFGFRIYAKGSICLQLAPTYGAIPFVTTNGAVNGEIEKDITTDRIADEFLTTFQSITFPIFKERIKKLSAERERAQTILDNLDGYDWREYEKLAEQLKVRYQAVRSYKFIQLNTNMTIPNLKIAIVPDIKLRCPTIVKFIDYGPQLKTYENTLNQYIDIMNGVCPTCGRKFIEHAS